MTLSRQKPAWLRMIAWMTLAIPFLAMLIMIGSNWLQFSQTEYRIKISGYDPRDLLRGHYLVFQYEWPDKTENNCPAGEAQKCCACFNTENNRADILFQSCDKLSKDYICDAVLPVTKTWNNTLQPHENLRRYYIPEQHAAQLETMLRSGTHQFEVALVPPRNHLFNTIKNGKVKMLYINNLTLPEFLAQTPYPQKD